MEFLKQIFGDEALTFEQLNEKLKGNDSIKLANIADGSYVAKSELDAVNNQLNETNKKLEGYDPEWKQKLLQAQSEADQMLEDYKFEQTIEKDITAAGGLDVVSIKANLDMSKVTKDKDGRPQGLSEQFEQLKTNKPFLFAAEKPEPTLNFGIPTQGLQTKSDETSQMRAVMGLKTE